MSALEVQRSTANPRRHCHWVGRSRRSDRIGCGSGASGSSARRRTSRHACKALPSRTRSSSLRARESSSAICSSCKTSEHKTSRASPSLCGLGRRCDRLRLKAASRPARERIDRACWSRRRTRTLLRRWSKAKTAKVKCSSTLWCRTPLTARCCESRDARFMLALQKPLESQFAEIAESPTRSAGASLR